jgi:hypothetical protein
MRSITRLVTGHCILLMPPYQWSSYSEENDEVEEPTGARFSSSLILCYSPQG